jgi:hypothetical protein
LVSDPSPVEWSEAAMAGAAPIAAENRPARISDRCDEGIKGTAPEH